MLERIELLRRAGEPGAPCDTERADRELNEWRTQTPFANGDRWSDRLAAAAVTEAELRRALGEPIEATAARCTEAPTWLVELELAFASPPRPAVESLPMQDAARLDPASAFLDVVEPILRRACERLRAAVDAIVTGERDLPIEPDRVPELFLDSLLAPVHMLLRRTLVLELNVARMQGQLVGDTPEARFATFVARLRARDAALALLGEYPVLARGVVEAANAWVDVTVEFLHHLAADWSALRTGLAVPVDAGPIAAIRGGAGDRHRGGRAVLIVTFASGFRLAYKPHSLAVDVHFHELLAWLNGKGDLLPFRTIAVLDRGDHGWTEFVATAPCADERAVARFYRRLGALVAVLHALDATDFHLENVIAAGEQPLPIDLETLFHGHNDLPRQPTADAELVNAAVNQSVLRIGLLPQRSFAVDGDTEGIDMSGIGAREGQLSPDSVVRFAAAGTDEMHAVRERLRLPGAGNQPTLDGGEIDLLAYRGEIEGGFVDAYRTLMRWRDELLAADGPIERFAADPMRSVLRATRGYGLIQLESKHPDFQRSGLELDRFLDRVWVGVDELPQLGKAVAAERAELGHGDIPLFTTTPSSRDVWSSRGLRVPDFWPEPGLAAVRRRIAAFDEVDLQRQVWFVRSSLATLTLAQDRLLWPAYEPARIAAPPPMQQQRETALRLATAVGNDLAARALRGPDGEVAWVALAFAGQQWSLLSLFEDLYGGYPGVIQFLAYLGHVTGQERFTSLARDAHRTLERRLDSTLTDMSQIGAFSGLGGLLYGYAHWSALWSDRTLLDRTAAIVDRLAPLIETDTDLDVIGGLAGCLLALLALDRVAPAAKHPQLARRCGDRLVELARPMAQGRAWFTRVQTEVPITGFSHGASGIAFALLALAQATGDERYRLLGLDALRYERTHFVEADQNWGGLVDPRTRDPETGRAPATPQNNTLLVSWCYGAPGIGLARLRALGLDRDPRLIEEANIALQTTLARGFGRNHCLCHGDLGNLDFVCQAAAALPGAPGADRIAPITASVLESMQRCGWLSGIPLSVESPSLMNGLAGIGLGLLRVARPEQVPSVLALEPPHLARPRS